LGVLVAICITIKTKPYKALQKQWVKLITYLNIDNVNVLGI